MNHKLAQTYVWHGDKQFFVSTINRESSAELAPGTYAETMAWELDKDGLARSNVVAQDEDCRDHLGTHLRIVQKLYEEGEVDED